MDLARQLKNAISSGNLLFGQRQTMSACNSSDARMVIIAANCPIDYIEDLRSRHPDVPMHQVALVNRELGAACGKPFAVSVLSVIDAGESDLLTLHPNVE
ncbi:MAG: 50S ribosomal protein L30e [Candidatus Thermoplasmatota archaeon]|nr:50S ribosomal protein L30e [Candidatus Thermoplasmatota archaeon]